MKRNFLSSAILLIAASFFVSSFAMGQNLRNNYDFTGYQNGRKYIAGTAELINMRPSGVGVYKLTQKYTKRDSRRFVSDLILFRTGRQAAAHFKDMIVIRNGRESSAGEECNFYGQFNRGEIAGTYFCQHGRSGTVYSFTLVPSRRNRP